MKTSKIDISIVVPVYNSDQSLPELTARVKSTLESMEVNGELIFVDDASSNPKTWEILQSIVLNEEKWVTAIQLSKNYGQQAATLCGLNASLGDYVVTMDDDLQHAPEDIANLWPKRNHDIVIGIFSNKHHTYWRNICSRMKGYFDFKLLGKPRHISLSPYRMLSRLVINNILTQNSIYPFIPAMMFSVTKDIVNVPITHAPRKYGKSNYSLKKMISLFGNLMINNSSYLLHLIGRIGVLVFLFTCGLGVALLVRKTIWGVNTTGWTSLFLAISIFGGLNLLAASIIGEYLIRIVRTIEKKPQFCIRHQIEHH